MSPSSKLGWVIWAEPICIAVKQWIVQEIEARPGMYASYLSVHINEQ